VKRVPNVLTGFRVALIPLIVFLIIKRTYIASLFFFLLSALTDYLDGYVARKYDGVTGVGMLLDPIADKILTISVLISLSYVNLCDPVSVILIVAREQAVTGLRAVAASKGVIIPADRSGKIKTFLIVLSVTLLLSGFSLAGEVFMVISALVAVISGLNYFLKFKRGLR